MRMNSQDTFLDKSIDWAIHHKFWVILLTLMFSFFTIINLKNISVDAVPDITNTQVVINTKTLGLDPSQVELMVTQLIELEMMGIPHLKDMRSISKIGLSQVTLIFEDNTNIFWARQQVSEKLFTVVKQLPDGVDAELAPISTGLGEVFMYALKLKKDSSKRQLSHQEQMIYLREIQDFQIRPLLRRVKDVADVDSNGGFKKELHINVNPSKLKNNGLTIEHITEALNGLGENFGGGSVNIGKESLIIKSSTQAKHIDEIGNIPLKQKFNGERLLLKEIAQISFDGAPRFGSATYDGEETVLGTVLMMSGGNGRLVSHDVEKILDDFSLPSDVDLVKLYSRGFLVDATLTTVIKSLGEGAILVILILLIVLGHLRAALIVAIIIPLSMLGTSYGMQLFHISGNLMSLGAIDFGLVVDGAVVLVETLLYNLSNLTEKEKLTFSKDKIVAEKAKLVMRPVFFGLLMIMLVYFPILLLEGIEGKMFKPMAYTVLMTLGWSLLATIFLIPVLVSIFIKIPSKDSKHNEETIFFKWIKKIYSPFLNLSVKHPRILMISAIAIIFISLFAGNRLGAEFIPQLDEGDLVINITRDASISLDEALKEQIDVDHAVQTFPEVLHVFSRLGTPESATDPMGVHLTDMFLILKKDRSTWTVTSKEDLYKKIKNKITSLGYDVELSSTQPIEMRFNEMLEGSRADISLRVLGDDLVYLVEAIDNFAVKIKNIEGLDGAEMDPLTALRKSRTIDIRPNFQMLSDLGISLETFNQTIVGFMQGVRIGHWAEGTRKFPIVIHLAEHLRHQRNELENLPVALPAGGSIPLQNVASIDFKEQVTTIARNWGRRYAALSINITDRDTMSFVEDLKKIIAKNPVKENHEIQLGGQFNNLEKAKKRLFLIIPLTLIFILVILWREFTSWADALLIFICVPFATMGGIWALFLRDINFSLSAAVGFIALIGIALLNGIVLLSVFRQLRLENESWDINKIVIQGTLSRLRPVIMTAMVASIGFIPMALNTGIGSEVQRPLASVVIGGIIFSTLLTLIIFPSFYLYLHQDKKSSLDN